MKVLVTRPAAQAAGSLKSNEQQKVVVQNPTPQQSVIVIEPAQPQVVCLWLQPQQLVPFSTAFFGAASTENWLSLVPRSWDDNTMLWSGSQAWYDEFIKVMTSLGWLPIRSSFERVTTSRKGLTVQMAALKRGLLLLTCGVYGNVIRFLFPLTIEDSVFAEALGVLDAALAEVLA